SLGVTFYEMLTGELPIGRFPLPSRKAVIDARLDDVVLRTLEKEPADRYQHASDVKTEVETIVRHPAPTPAPSSTNAGIEALKKGAAFWTTPQPNDGRWVGLPMLALVGLYMLLVCGLMTYVVGWT